MADLCADVSDRLGRGSVAGRHTNEEGGRGRTQEVRKAKADWATESKDGEWRLGISRRDTLATAISLYTIRNGRFSPAILPKEAAKRRLRRQVGALRP